MKNLKQQIENLTEDQELTINIPNGTIEVYCYSVNEEYSVTAQSDDFDSHHCFYLEEDEDVQVVVDEVENYLTYND